MLLLVIILVAAAAGVLGEVLEFALWAVVLLALAAGTVAGLGYLAYRRVRT